MTEDSRSEVKELEKIYGVANSNGYGSAVFYEALPNGAAIEVIAFKHYRNFIGSKWNVETESEWLSGWKNIYIRHAGTTPNILSELEHIADPTARNAVPLLTELITDAEQGRKALSSVFDDPQVAELTVNLVGDSASMSGIIITGVISNTKVCSVICLMD